MLVSSSCYYHHLVIKQQMVLGVQWSLSFMVPPGLLPVTHICCVTLRPGIRSKGIYERPGLRTHGREASLEGLSFWRKCLVIYPRSQTGYFLLKLLLEEWSKEFSIC